MSPRERIDLVAVLSLSCIAVGGTAGLMLLSLRGAEPPRELLVVVAGAVGALAGALTSLPRNGTTKKE